MITPQTEALLGDLLMRLQQILPTVPPQVLARLAFTEVQKWNVAVSEKEVEDFVRVRTGR
ncbi:MAG: hypothetical protein AB7F35_01100 [Acetobacteraceae bacterium]